MKTLLATSRVTFVPDNYDTLVTGLAGCPEIAGLLVLENRNFSLLLKMLGLGLAGASRITVVFFRNWFGTTAFRRRAAFAAAGKPVWTLPAVNCPETLDIIRKNRFDLVLNARTRSIYRNELLIAPRLGCLNIHHGLLPEQRGTMCDLWALHEKQPAGFSVHVMTEKLDAGPVLWREQVSDGSDRDYPAYLAKAAGREREVVAALLKRIAQQDEIVTQTNTAVSGSVLRRNPVPAQIRAMRRSGLII